MTANWIRTPSGFGYSWRVWDGDAEERGHCTTKEQAMVEIQDACRRVGGPVPFESPDPIDKRLREARTLLEDSFQATDNETAELCVRQALDHVNYAIKEL